MANLLIFGHKIEVPRLAPSNQFEEILPTLLKRDSERKQMEKFLDGVNLDGRKRIEEIEERISLTITDGDIENVQSKEVEAYTVKCLKRMKLGNGISVYEDLILKIVEVDCDIRIREYISNLRRGKVSDVPKSFPVMHKKADAILIGRLKSDIDDETVKSYIFNKRIKTNLVRYAKEIFFANNLGLSEAEVLKYLSILYELEHIQTQDPFNSFLFKKRLCEGVARGSVDLVHIKCLRFNYEGGKIRVITDVDDIATRGEYIPDSETNLFPRLLGLKHVLENHGLLVNFHICVSDEDIEILYPKGTSLITTDQKEEAVRSAGKYTETLRVKFGSEFDIEALSDQVAKAGDKYIQVRKMVLEDLRLQGGRYINPDSFEKDKVDYQYNFNRGIFGEKYTRGEARRSVSEEIASLIGLKEILAQLTESPILVEERLGNDGCLVANGEVPIFFMKLHDKLVES